MIETLEANLSQGWRQLNGVYTQRFNRNHSHVGHVFQGRYKAILMQKSAYLLELARYIVFNPVRAGMVRTARDWPWSSYLMTAGLKAVPQWLMVDWLLSGFSNSRREAIERYKQFVVEGKNQPSPWEQLKNQIYLGDEAFVDEIQCKMSVDQKLEEVPAAQKRPSPKPLNYYEKNTLSVMRLFYELIEVVVIV